MDDPKFEYNRDYYFDVEKFTIYGKEKHSFLYFHELSHYRDYQNAFYKKISMFFSQYIQFIALIFPIFVIFWSFMPKFPLIFGIYAGFIIQEEARAYYNAYKWHKEYNDACFKKVLKNGK